jgi:hypothetical protein
MRIAMSTALMLMRIEGLGYFRDFSTRDLFWLAVGVVVTLLVSMLVRRRRRWF